MPSPRAARHAIIAALVAGALIAGGFWQLRPAPRPNLLLITVDTLRADRVGAYGHTAAATPTIDALAARGVRFARVQASAPLTGPSHATMLTGQYPPVHGVRDNAVFTLGPEQHTLAERLHAAGYRTAAFVAAYPVAALFGFAQGFDVFDEHFQESRDAGHGAERPANEVADTAIGWLQGLDDTPFFAWLHFYDPHAPYAPPPPFDVSHADRPYDGEIAFVDTQIARVLEALRARGLLDDTVVVVTADHGESLGEHRELTHAVLIYESTLRVPLIVTGPGIPPGRVVAARVGTVDILPTVLRLCGLEADPSLAGRDLQPTRTSGEPSTQPLYAESLFGRLNLRWAPLRSWTRDRWKLVQGAEVELFDLDADPGELRDVSSTETATVRRLEDELQRALQHFAPGGDRARPNPLGAEQEERLRSLGYASAAGARVALDAPDLPDPRPRVPIYDRAQAASQARGEAAGRAIADLTALVALDPENPFLHGTLASVAYRAGELATAATAFARALDLDPDRPAVRQNYGKLLRELGAFDASERELAIAVEQSPAGDAAVRASLAVTLVAQGKLDAADTLLAPLLARDPEQHDAIAAHARLLAARGRGREAVPLFERAASVDPEVGLELARLQLHLGDTTAARRAASAVLRAIPGHPWALAIGGHALILDGRAADGRTLLQQALAAAPRRPDAWRALADAFDAAGDQRAAARCRAQAAASANAILNAPIRSR